MVKSFEFTAAEVVRILADHLVKIGATTNEGYYAATITPNYDDASKTTLTLKWETEQNG
jgi:hypothetical protein